MKITSLNLRGFFDWDTRAPRIEHYLRATDPDVILFQEVVYLRDISPHTQVDLLNARLRYPYRHSSVTRLQSSPEFGAYREGLSVLSRYPVPQSEALVLLREDGDPHNRLVQCFDVSADDTTWRFANVHLSVRDDYALHQLREVLAMLASRDERRIIGGDFNINHLEQHAHLWRDSSVLTTELEHYVSYAGSNQAEDYFLVPKQHAIGSIELSGDGLSDHRALTVEIARADADADADASPVAVSP